MNQRRHRRRPFHRVRQPDKQGDLRGLAGRAEKQQQGRNGDHAHRAVFDRARVGGGGDLLEIQRAEGRKQQQHAEDKAEIADAVDDERLLAGVGGRLFAEPEADEEVRTEADPFPADEHHQEARAEHEHEHE